MDNPVDTVEITVEQYAVLDLIVEIGELRAENKRLRRRVHDLTVQRERWRNESKAWKWGALRWHRNASTS